MGEQDGAYRVSRARRDVCSRVSGVGEEGEGHIQYVVK